MRRLRTAMVLLLGVGSAGSSIAHTEWVEDRPSDSGGGSHWIHALTPGMTAYWDLPAYGGYGAVYMSDQGNEFGGQCRPMDVYAIVFGGTCGTVGDAAPSLGAAVTPSDSHNGTFHFAMVFGAAQFRTPWGTLNLGAPLLTDDQDLGSIEDDARFYVDRGYVTHPNAVEHGAQAHQHRVWPVNETGGLRLPKTLGDYDGDGTTDATEADAGSSPYHRESHPGTDDDGDGTNNGGEPVPFPIPSATAYAASCTGTYGYLYGPPCGGYAKPAGCAQNTVSDAVCVQTGLGGGIWVFDPVCIPDYTSANPYGRCKNGNYVLNATPYAGSYLPDGYGWRRVANTPVTFPQDVNAVGPCTANFIADADGDRVPRARFCHKYYRVNSTGTFYERQPESQNQALGDPNDNDDQSPVPTQILLDVDGDGTLNADEVAGNSNVATAQSRPATDDDGDGQPNGAESGPWCSGAYFVVWMPDCGGYAAPAACHVQGALMAGLLCITPTGQVWAWDPVCEGLGTDWNQLYQRCRDTTAYQPAPGQPQQTGDGYGWRLRGTVPTTFGLVSVCPGYPMDQDADQVPTVSVCRQDYRVAFDGTVTEQGPATPIATPPLGDPDDSDAQIPIPHLFIQETLGEAERILGEAAQFVGTQIASLQATADKLRGDVENFTKPGNLERIVAEAAQNLTAYGAIVLATAARTAAEASAFGACGGPVFTQYAENATAAANQFVATVTPQAFETFLATVQVGGAEAQERFADCADEYPLSRPLLDAARETVALLGNATMAIDRALEAGGNTLAALQDLVGVGGENVQSLINGTVAVGAQVTQYARSTSEGLVAVAEVLVGRYADPQQAQDDVAQILQPDPPLPPGTARVLFHVENATGTSQSGANVFVFDQAADLGNKSTDPDGNVEFRVQPGERYDYRVTLAGYKPRSGSLTAPAEGQTLRRDVQLVAVGDDEASLGVWLFGLAGLVLLAAILVSRRRR